MNTSYDTQENPQFYTPAALSARWRVTPMTLRRWRKAGKLKTHHFGRGIRFSAAEVARIENESVA